MNQTCFAEFDQICNFYIILSIIHLLQGKQVLNGHPNIFYHLIIV